MPYSHALVELDKIPDDYNKEAIIEFAERHNALVKGAGEIKKEIDQITGETPEQKAEFHGIFGKIRAVFHYFHEKRFNATMLIAQASGLLWIAKQFGVKPDQVSRLVEVGLKMAEKYSSSL